MNRAGADNGGWPRPCKACKGTSSFKNQQSSLINRRVLIPVTLCTTQRAAVFPPHGGVAFPVVEIFNAPVLADDGGKLLVGAFARLDTGDEVAVW